MLEVSKVETFPARKDAPLQRSSADPSKATGSYFTKSCDIFTWPCAESRIFHSDAIGLLTTARLISTRLHAAWPEIERSLRILFNTHQHTSCASPLHQHDNCQRRRFESPDCCRADPWTPGWSQLTSVDVASPVLIHIPTRERQHASTMVSCSVCRRRFPVENCPELGTRPSNFDLFHQLVAVPPASSSSSSSQQLRRRSSAASATVGAVAIPSASSLPSTCSRLILLGRPVGTPSLCDRRARCRR